MSNIYFIGMCISMVIYIVIGIVVSRRIKDVNDYYVAGRRAPVLLIAGSLIASFVSTGMFMGDAAMCYEGAFSSIVILVGLMAAGYVLGAVFFGRYLRRSSVLTIPEYFGKRFNSKAVRILAAATAIVMMGVYLLSVIQGVGTLMNAVTGVDYNTCVILTLVVLTLITVIAGSRGVLLTDTLMASVFTIALVVSAIIIIHNAGGIFGGVSQLTQNPETREILSWAGKPGALYDVGWKNVFWGVNYGIAWMAVVSVGPWQSSRYLMAKDERTVVKSAIISAVGIFSLEFLAGITAVIVNVYNDQIEDSSHVLIWAAMNILPRVLGVILLTGVLAAGVSSATTFLSLIGSSFANDIIDSNQYKTDGKKAIRYGQIAMVVVSLGIGIFAVLNPPALYWILLLGGAIVASSWMPVAFASVFSKKLTKAGAFCGMLVGFLGCFGLKLYSSITGTEFPVWLDPSIVGMIVNVIAMIIVSKFTSTTSEEEAFRQSLFIIPENEKKPEAVADLMKWTKGAVFVGVILFALMLIMWVVPYLGGIK